MREKLKIMTKEERDTLIHRAMRDLADCEDELIMAEISGIYSLLEEVRELLIKRVEEIKKLNNSHA